MGKELSLTKNKAITALRNTRDMLAAYLQGSAVDLEDIVNNLNNVLEEGDNL